MDYLDACYFCTTPYQMITSMIMCKNNREKADIYIDPQFRQAKLYADNLKKIGLFNRVSLVDTTGIDNHKNSNNTVIMHLGIAKKYFDVDKIAKRIVFPDTYYSKMYVSSKAYIGRMVYLYNLKHGIDTELIYFDDGEGSYYNPSLTKAKNLDKIARYIAIGRKSLDKRPHSLYLFDPELYKSLNGANWSGNIYEIPRALFDSDMQNKVSKVFDFSEEDLINEPVIILDVLKDEVHLGNSEKQKLISIYDMVRDAVSAENLIIKRHPRDTSEESSGFKYYKRFNMPFECLCARMNMDKKVLIAISSTAVVVPKILLDKEPIVILLYRIINHLHLDSESFDKQNDFYNKCKSRYNDSSRFYIPETIDELKSILEHVSSFCERC